MKLSRINNLLLLLVILINGFIIIAPLWPAVQYKVQAHGTKQRQLTQELQNTPTATQDNQLVAPAMLLDTPIHEGSVSQAYSVLNQGIWRWPKGSSPDKGGNTVLIGHRYTYTNPRGVFYHLDKLRPGDRLAVFWNGHRYTYKVSSTRTVPASETTIQAPTDTDQLTLYTCTPLWLPKDRLVVVAILESKL